MRRLIILTTALLICALFNFSASAKPSFCGKNLHQAIIPADSSGPIVSNVLTKTQEGYAITFTGNYFSKQIGKTLSVDVAMVDFTSMLAMKLRTYYDTMQAIIQIYSNPANFSIVTGTLTPTSNTTAKLTTKCTFSPNIGDPKYTIVIVPNNGVKNCGATTAPSAFYAKAKITKSTSTGGGSCGSCGCNCFRAGSDNHCVYCF